MTVVTPWYPMPAAPYAGVFVADLVAEYRSRGLNPTVVHLQGDPDSVAAAGPEVTETIVDRVPVRRVLVPGDPHAPRFMRAKDYARQLQRHASDLLDVAAVHGHTGHPIGYALAQTLPSGPRVVISEHASYLNQVLEDPRARTQYLEGLARAAYFTCPTPALTDSLKELDSRYADRIRYVSNLLPRDRLPRERLRSGGDRWLVIGNLIERKRVDRAIRAVAVTPEASLTIVGSGPEEERLRRLASECDVTDRVSFVGTVAPTALAEFYDSHDVLLHLPEAEPFGMVTIEAAAAGLGVVCSESGGPEQALQWVRHLGGVEIVANADDPVAVSSAVAEIHARPRQSGARAILEAQAGAEHVVGQLALYLGLRQKRHYFAQAALLTRTESEAWTHIRDAALALNVKVTSVSDVSEVKPVSRWRRGGYEVLVADSPRDRRLAAQPMGKSPVVAPAVGEFVRALASTRSGG